MALAHGCHPQRTPQRLTKVIVPCQPAPWVFGEITRHSIHIKGEYSVVKMQHSSEKHSLQTSSNGCGSLHVFLLAVLTSWVFECPCPCIRRVEVRRVPCPD